MSDKLRQLAATNNRLFHTVTALSCYRTGLSEQVNAEVIRANIRNMGGIKRFNRELAKHQDDDGGSLELFQLTPAEMILVGLEKG